MEEGAVFDERVMVPITDEDIMNCFLWRQQFDCSRNAVMAIAQSVFTSKELHGVKCREAIIMLEEKGISVTSEHFPAWNVCEEGTQGTSGDELED
jgi:tRNA(His) guanylyltransferase